MANPRKLNLSAMLTLFIDSGTHPGTYLRLSRLWDVAKPLQTLKEKDFKKLVEPILHEHLVVEPKSRDLLQPLAELLVSCLVNLFRNRRICGSLPRSSDFIENGLAVGMPNVAFWFQVML